MDYPDSLHPDFQACIEHAKQLAGTDSLAVIYGPTGSGKEHLANAMHASSPRVKEPFVPVVVQNHKNALFESEMYGHEKGSFTGAEKYHKGAIEQVGGGTLFIDEFQNADLKTQQKLLRFVETREYRAVGGETLKKFQGRMIFAMNDHPDTLLKKNRLLPDMYYRIAHNVHGIPPLRFRRQDIPELIRDAMQIAGAGDCKLGPEDAAFIEEYSFPGNVRELLSLVASACDRRTDHSISLKSAWELRHKKPAWYLLEAAEKQSAKEVQNEPVKIIGVDCKVVCKLANRDYREAKEYVDCLYITEALESTGGNVTIAAERLGMHRRHLIRKIKQYGLGKNGET